MNPADLLRLVDHFGPWVVIAAIMAWNQSEDRKAARQRAVDEIERQKEDRMLARERITTDREQAGSLTLLATKIDGMRR